MGSSQFHSGGRIDDVCQAGGSDCHAGNFQGMLISFLLILCAITASFYLGAWIYIRIKKRFMVSLQICGSGVCRETIDENIHASLLRWIAKNPNCESFQDHMLISKTVSLPEDQQDNTSILTDKEEREMALEGMDAVNLCRPRRMRFRPSSSPNNWKYCFFKTIGFGQENSFLYKNATIEITRTYQDSHEIITLSTLKWNADLLMEIVSEAKPLPKKDDKTTQIIYQGREGCGWQQLGGPKTKRSINSLVLDTTILPKLVGDIKSFLKMEDWYVEKGIPYRRGYLLHGPPGCGKSSIVKAVAGDLGYNICVLSLSQKLTDDSVTELLNHAPQKSVILLEDIDAAFGSREEKKEDETVKAAPSSNGSNNFAYSGQCSSLLTFRGLLNALDGVASSDDGQLVFMTTNYPERLDPALIRPGRVDLKIHVGYPDDTQVGGMFDKFYPNYEENEQTKKEFVDVIKSMKFEVSLAMIQGLLFVYRDNPKDAVEHAETHFKEQFANPYSTGAKKGIYC